MPELVFIASAPAGKQGKPLKAGSYGAASVATVREDMTIGEELTLDGVSLRIFGIQRPMDGCPRRVFVRGTRRGLRRLIRKGWEQDPE